MSCIIIITSSFTKKITMSNNVALDKTSPIICKSIEATGSIIIDETTAPTATAGKSIIYSDSSTHNLKISSNGGSFNPLQITGTATTFPTSGGTAASLDYYEIYSATITFGGPWASTQNATMTLVRLGKHVSMSINGVAPTLCTSSATASTTSVAIPARFLPPFDANTTLMLFGGQQVSDGTSNRSQGYISVSIIGTINVGVIYVSGSSFNYTGFTSGLTSGWTYFLDASWICA